MPATVLQADPQQRCFAVRSTHRPPPPSVRPQGVGNIASSFFACAPMAASLSRSLIMENVGGRTQASGIITSSILLVVLLWLGPVFEVLPKVRSCPFSAF